MSAITTITVMTESVDFFNTNDRTMGVCNHSDDSVDLSNNSNNSDNTVDVSNHSDDSVDECL